MARPMCEPRHLAHCIVGNRDRRGGRFLGTPEDVIQDLLGHATTTTRTHYIHLREHPAVRQALGRLSVVLGGVDDQLAGEGVSGKP